jgi:hypothetical protein
MADPTTFPEEHVREPLVYRRISGFAIAAVIVAACYALIVLIACVSGLSRGTPVLMSPWLQFLAVIGAGLAIAGLVHVNRSEDTVAGAKLALWSLLISVFFGLGYGAYYVATYFAIRQQANDFTRRWFKKLEEGKTNLAFLDTQDPAVRQRINPEDDNAIDNRFAAAGPRGMPQKSPLESFRENKLVRRLVQGGPESQITPLGVKDWEYAGGGYRVRRGYRIETEEGTFEAQVTALGSQSKTREYEGREWQIITGGTGMNEQGEELSERGKEIGNLRLLSGQFIDEWGNKLVSGRLAEAYLDTLEPAERGKRADEFSRRQGNVPILTLQSDKFVASDEETKDHILSAVKEIFSPVRTGDSRLLALRPGFGPSGYRTWKIDQQQRLRLPHDCKLSIAVSGQLRYTVDVTITTESDPGPVTASRRPAWRIISVELMHGEDVRRSPSLPGQAAS